MVANYEIFKTSISLMNENTLMKPYKKDLERCFFFNWKSSMKDLRFVLLLNEDLFSIENNFQKNGSI